MISSQWSRINPSLRWDLAANATMVIGSSRAARCNREVQKTYVGVLRTARSGCRRRVASGAPSTQAPRWQLRFPEVSDTWHAFPILEPIHTRICHQPSGINGADLSGQSSARRPVHDLDVFDCCVCTHPPSSVYMYTLWGLMVRMPWGAAWPRACAWRPDRLWRSRAAREKPRAPRWLAAARCSCRQASKADHHGRRN